MSTVTLSIGPKSYTIACGDGEEAHVRALGAMIAEKYAKLGTARAPLEAQNLVFAALFMADELDQARKRLAEIDAAPPAPVADPVDPEAITALQNAIAALEADLAAARDAAAAAAETAAPSDLFEGAADQEIDGEALAERLEAIAAEAEAHAAALEAIAASA